MKHGLQFFHYQTTKPKQSHHHFTIPFFHKEKIIGLPNEYNHKQFEANKILYLSREKGYHQVIK